MMTHMGNAESSMLFPQSDIAFHHSLSHCFSTHPFVQCFLLSTRDAELPVGVAAFNCHGLHAAVECRPNVVLLNDLVHGMPHLVAWRKYFVRHL